uniref:Uncharacterized protein n=1 Tax=Picea glauca TaxID=3330 RepID=A0A101M3X3_PICGL|nr:hypothetical protein ABT39_MTgene282 [Picea glauca]
MAALRHITRPNYIPTRLSSCTSDPTLASTRAFTPTLPCFSNLCFRIDTSLNALGLFSYAYAE